MHQSLRSLPDSPLASMLAAAYGRLPTVEADPHGLWAAVRLPSGRSLVAAVSRMAAAFPGFVRPELVVTVGADAGRAVNTLDDLADLRLDLEVLARASELVELYVGGALRLAHFESAMAAAQAGDNDEEVAEFAMQEAREHELDLGDGEPPAPGACLVELALALRELIVLSIEHATEICDEVLETAADAIDAMEAT